MKNNGIFISMEGMDGSGKSTQILKIREFMQAEKFEVLLTREPGGTPISEKIRGVLLDPDNTAMAESTELLLYASARAQLIHQVIKPAVENGKVVICDRFLDSSIAYQGFGRGIPIYTIMQINDTAINGMMPDITFFLDIRPEVSLKRRIEATGADRIEQEDSDFHARVYAGYKHMAEKYPERIRVINAERGIEEIFHDIKLSLNEILSSRRIK